MSIYGVLIRVLCKILRVDGLTCLLLTFLWTLTALGVEGSLPPPEFPHTEVVQAEVLVPEVESFQDSYGEQPFVALSIFNRHQFPESLKVQNDPFWGQSKLQESGDARDICRTDSASRIECQVCGGASSRLSGSAAGMFLCMGVFLLWKWMGSRRAATAV